MATLTGKAARRMGGNRAAIKRRMRQARKHTYHMKVEQGFNPIYSNAAKKPEHSRYRD